MIKLDTRLNARGEFCEPKRYFIAFNKFESLVLSFRLFYYNDTMIMCALSDAWLYSSSAGQARIQSNFWARFGLLFCSLILIFNEPQRTFVNDRNE